jgi:heme O synthase-like polyprenyltransferase
MLPAQTGRGHAAWWVLLHSVATGVAALALAVVPALGLIYFVPTLLATGYLLRRNIVLLRRPDPVNARAMFVASNLYLMIVLLTLLVASLLR